MLRLIRYLTMLFLILATFCHAAEAADYTFSASDYEAYTQQGESDPNKYAPKPPVAGGSVTGKFLEPRYHDDGSFSHYHEGLDIGVTDIGIYAPVDGTVWHGSGISSNFGEGWVYFVSDDDAYPTKIRMFVGDLNAETANLPSEVHVSRGTQIGYVLGHVYPSTGAHPHFQFYNRDPASPYAPFLNINGEDRYGNIDPGPLINPYYMLTELGSDLTGTVDYSGPRGGETGADGGQNTSLTVASLEYVGNLLNKIVKDWTEIATKSIGSVTPYALSILTALCIIDLSIPLALGMFSSFNPNKLIVKAIRYASVFALIIYWPEFINNILISFIETFGTAFSSDIESITAGVTQPQLLLQKALFVITPAFQKIASFGFYDYKANFGQVIMIYIWTFFLAGVYINTAAYIALCWLEFYISAGLNVVTVPFSSWKMSKFIPEGMGGHLISSALKLLFISILVGMVSLFKLHSFMDFSSLFKTQKQNYL